MSDVSHTADACTTVRGVRVYDLRKFCLRFAKNTMFSSQIKTCGGSGPHFNFLCLSEYSMWESVKKNNN